MILMLTADNNPTYIRFIVPKNDEQSRSYQGIFHAAIELRNNGSLEDYEEDLLEEELKWYRMHLRVPECLGETGNDRAICWFQSEARKPLERIRPIVALLKEKGVPVEQVTTQDPGTIIYMDKWQVIAKPSKK